MSSEPFRLGLPVIDRIHITGGSYVLRAETREKLLTKVRRTQEMLTPDDAILVFEIGYRPDRPIPVRAYFAEIKVVIGDAKSYDGNVFWRQYSGTRKAKMIMG